MLDTSFPCFPIPISIYNFNKDSHEMNLKLLNDIFTEKENNDGVINSNFGGWHSKDMSKYQSFQELKTIIESSIDDYCVKHGYYMGIKIDTLWSNINSKGDYNKNHHHAESALAGVYYPVKIVTDSSYQFNYTDEVSLQPGMWDGSNGGCLSIQDPSYGMKTGLRKIRDSMSPYNFDHYHLYPVSGVLVLFPSYILHDVSPFQKDVQRVSISFSCCYSN